jgi:hypothetical protein
MKRDIVYKTEKRIKALCGNEPFHRLRRLNEAEWDLLNTLINIREMALNELMVPTPYEVEVMRELNDKLLKITDELYDRAFRMWKTLNGSDLKPHLYNYLLEGCIDFEWDGFDTVRTLDTDGWYGSDFTYMLWLLSEYQHQDYHCTDHLHDIVENFGMAEEEAKKDLSDFLDDGKTWAEGSYMTKPEFDNICFCYLMHAVCTHFNYSLPDVMHMDNFVIRVHLEYDKAFSNTRLQNGYYAEGCDEETRHICVGNASRPRRKRDTAEAESRHGRDGITTRPRRDDAKP